MHRASVHSLAYSPDGRRLASAAWDGTVVVWEASTGRELMRASAKDPAKGLDSVAFSPDGKWLVAPFDKVLQVLDAETLRPRYRSQREEQPVTLAVPSPDGALLATVTYPDELVLRAADTGVVRLRLREDASIPALAWSPEGKTLAVAGRDGKIRLRSLPGLALAGVLEGHTREVTSLAFAPSGGVLVSGSEDDTVRFWDPARQVEQHRLEQVHSQGVNAVAFSPDGKLLATGGGMGLDVRLWDARTRALRCELDTNYLTTQTLAFAPDGKSLAIGGWDYQIRLIDVPACRALRVSAGHERAVQAVAFSRDGRRVFSGGDDERLIAWDARTGARLRERELPSRASSIAASPDGKRLAIVLGGMWRVLVADAGTLADRAELEGGENEVVFGREVVLAADGRRVKAWRSRTLEPQPVLASGLMEVWSLALSADGALLALGGNRDLESGQVQLWALGRDGKRTRGATLGGHRAHVGRVRLLPGGGLASLSYEQLRLWNLATGKLIREIALPGQLLSLDVSPDGRSIAAGGSDGIVRVWRRADGKLLRALSGHAGSVWSVAFSPDGRRLVSGSTDSSVLVWEAPAP
jgi:WD40 repeat protein